jgi:hypothetical protein
MTFRFILDEQVEPQVQRYLEREGHDTVHVREINELGAGAGADDSEVAMHSMVTGRHILTNDDHFYGELTDDLPTVFYFPNQRLAAYKLVSIIEIIEQQFTANELKHEPVVKVVEGWL